LAAVLAVTGVWAFVLLNRTPDWLPALRWMVLAGSVIVAVLAVGLHRLGRATVVVAVAAALFGLGATAAYSIETMSQGHSGPMTMSGPAKAGGFGFGGPGGKGGPDGKGGPGGPGSGPFGFGGDNAALEALVKDTDSRWAAASVGSFTVSDLELKTGTSLMAIGGFSGGDPWPTLAQFQHYVADGQVRYFIAGREGGPMGHRTGVANDITTWVEQHFTKTDVDGTTVYDLQPQP
jgi:4-amino-4-deoxy-L-arabinose transferase-like glycosyltransferase